MKRLFFILFLLTMSIVVFPQSKADRFFERGEYLEALKAYQRELEGAGVEGSEKSDLLKMRVANCFFHLNDVVRAGQMYKTVNPDLLGAEDLTYFAITLLRAGEYKKGAEQIDLAESLGADPNLIDRLKGSCEFAKEVAQMKPLYAANKTKINFAGFSAGVTYYKGKSVILAAPGSGENALKDSRGYQVTRLYNAVFTGDGTSGRLLPFADDLADKYHIGAVTFTKDYKRIYYSRTILKKDGTSILKLMTAEELNGKWENIRELDVNSEDYSCAHPCLYRDSLLFFVSDMPGGIGGKDIYMTTVQGPECGEVHNLGEQVNTIFDELFPFMAEDGKLYFASNGHIGLGGLDVFVSQMSDDGFWSAPANMGRPINSSMDDFALVFKDVSCTEGYVSSNRGGTGYNDFLFSLKLLFQPREDDRKLARMTVAGRDDSKVERTGKVGKMESAEKAEQLDVHKKAEQGEEVQRQVSSQEMFSVDYNYTIQIGAFRNPVPRIYFESFRNVKVYLGYDNIYRYTVGEYPKEEIANSELSYIRQSAENAFVVNVDRYVADRRIQNDVKGDQLTDDELLLRRLKKFEGEGKRKPTPRATSVRRFLNKPQNSELRKAAGYTVAFMSVDQVFDPTKYVGLGEVDVCASSNGEYMYCSGIYMTSVEAAKQLERVRKQGFKDAYVLHRNNGELYSESTISKNMEKRNTQGLKQLLTQF
ncbi:MAG: hypothetical protein RSB69_06940 [Odoribacter sp.]